MQRARQQYLSGVGRLLQMSSSTSSGRDSQSVTPQICGSTCCCWVLPAMSTSTSRLLLRCRRSIRWIWGPLTLMSLHAGPAAWLGNTARWIKGLGLTTARVMLLNCLMRV